MLNYFQSTYIVVATVVATLSLLVVLNRVWPPDKRRIHNDIIGWQLSVVGTTYAVIIGFMLYAVWTNFEVANVNADQEANALVNVYRLADGLPAAQRDQIHQLAVAYANDAVEKEWPAMAQGSTIQIGSQITNQLWTVITTTATQNTSEQINLDHAITQLANMTMHRRTRQLQSQSGLPGVLWVLLIIGAALIIGSTCMFGTSNVPLHLFQVFALTFMVSLALVAIADIDRPFQGSVCVSSHGFLRAQETFREYATGSR